MSPASFLIPLTRHRAHIAQGLLAGLVFAMSMGASAQQTATERDLGADVPSASGAIRLRQGQNAQGAQRSGVTPEFADDRLPGPRVDPIPLYVPGEFEQFVQKQAGTAVEVRRFGSELVAGSPDGGSTELSPLVPAEYIVGPGDEVLLILWGSVDADLRLIVDRGGRISIPRVGAVQVSGVRYSDLQNVVSRRIAQVFKNYELSVSLGQLRGIRVLVTGFVVKPGGYTVSSVSTVVAALMRAGGPAASGSFRAVELKRGGKAVSTIDLYDLLLKGDRSTDQILQAGDVVHVPAVGVQVGIIGSVNKPTVMELRPGETVSDALMIAGGFSAVADRSRLAVERLLERNAARVAQLELPAGMGQTLSHGDVLRIFSAVDIVMPTQRQSKRVRIEGEVQRPAEYVLPEGSSISDAVRIAGGYTPAAYVFAAELTRISVQRTQEENYGRALRDLETNLARSVGSRRISTAEEVSGAAASERGNSLLIERLRALRPNGRVVLQLPPDASELPDLALEDGDRIFVPARPTTVGVFGSVFNAATYLYLPGRSAGDYLKLAGGPTKGADEISIFVVRANGTVSSGRQRGGWFNKSGDFLIEPVQPGDTIFVPEEINKTTLTQNLREWGQIFSQFGLGLAALKVLGN